MRTGEEGKQYFEKILTKMSDAHSTTLMEYGEDNRERLVGAYETSSYDKFSWGVASRSSSVRVPNAVKEAGWKGYLEDRRVSSNCDPYRVASQLFTFI
jgi:glutamine synthetase